MGYLTRKILLVASVRRRRPAGGGCACSSCDCFGPGRTP